MSTEREQCLLILDGEHRLLRHGARRRVEQLRRAVGLPVEQIAHSLDPEVAHGIGILHDEGRNGPALQQVLL